MHREPTILQRIKLFVVAWTGFVAMMTIVHALQLIPVLQAQDFQVRFTMCTSADASSVRRHVEGVLSNSNIKRVSVAAGKRTPSCPDRGVFDVEFDALLPRSDARAIFGSLTDPAQDMYEQSLSYSVSFPAHLIGTHVTAALPAMIMALLIWLALERRAGSKDTAVDRSRKVVQKALVCFLVAFTLSSALGWTLGVIGLLQQSEAPAQGITLSVGLIALVAAPVTEEVVFRYWLLQRMSLAIGPFAALLLSSVMFSLAHLELEPFALCARLIAGLCLGVLWLRTSSLWACVLAHGLLNAGVLGLSALASTAGN